METIGSRPAHRRGAFLRPNQDPATAIEDMRPRHSQDLLTIELKPKWLLQSPDAPLGARRCRMCALRTLRMAERAKDRSSDERRATAAANEAFEGAFCPLDLVSGDETRVAATVDAVLRARSDVDEPTATSARPRLVAFLLRCEALRALQALQEDYNPQLHLATGESVDVRTAWAMTLRDCTLFIRVS